MGIENDAAFVSRLQAMAGSPAARPSTLPAETVVRAARRRVAGRRAWASSALGLVLLTGAGFAAANQPPEQATLVAPVAALQRVEIQPTLAELPSVESTDARDEAVVNLSPVAITLGATGVAALATGATFAIKSRTHRA